MVIRIGLIGIGKIARDQHIPALAADPHFKVVATVSRSGAAIDGVPTFTDFAALSAAGHKLDAVSLCTPPEGRAAIASAAIAAGLHVMLEKPPGIDPAEVEHLAKEAREANVTLFASWHSRAAGGVEPARAWLADRRIARVDIVWKEDIRRWHPGQEWILDAGGFGVFDPGINALSILTAILAGPIRLDSARLEVPEERGSPIAAALQMQAGDTPVTAAFDFRQTGPQSWDIIVDTDAGRLTLSQGGSVLTLPGEAPLITPDREYPNLYGRFASLIDAGLHDVDPTPLALVCDALAIGQRETVPAFAF